MCANSSSVAPLISDSAYQRLVARGTRMIKSGVHWFNAEIRLRRHALSLLSPRLPDRREHAEDLALQAVSDACRHLGVSHLMEEAHENEPVENKPFAQMPDGYKMLLGCGTVPGITLPLCR